MSFTKLDETFGIAPAAQPQPVVVYEEKNPNASETEQQKEDFDQTRTILSRILTKAEVALDEMMLVARETEKGRDYEIVGQMAKNIADMADKLLEAHDRMNKVKKTSGTQTPVSAPVTNQTMNQQNIIISATPSELLEMMRKNKNES